MSGDRVSRPSAMATLGVCRFQGVHCSQYRLQSCRGSPLMDDPRGRQRSPEEPPADTCLVFSLDSSSPVVYFRRGTSVDSLPGPWRSCTPRAKWTPPRGAFTRISRSELRPAPLRFLIRKTASAGRSVSGACCASERCQWAPRTKGSRSNGACFAYAHLTLSTSRAQFILCPEPVLPIASWLSPSFIKELMSPSLNPSVTGAPLYLLGAIAS